MADRLLGSPDQFNISVTTFQKFSTVANFDPIIFRTSALLSCTKQTKLRGLSPRENYNDREAAACQRS
jgi:hypothetical protein